MDLLSQYKQQNPEAFREQKPRQMTDAYGREQSGMIALVIRLSGDRIKDARQATITLGGIALFVLAVTVIIFWSALSGPAAAPRGRSSAESMHQAVP